MSLAALQDTQQQQEDEEEVVDGDERRVREHREGHGLAQEAGAAAEGADGCVASAYSTDAAIKASSSTVRQHRSLPPNR